MPRQCYLIHTSRESYLVQEVPSGTERLLPRKFRFTMATIEDLPVQAKPPDDMPPAVRAAATTQRLHWDTDMPCFGVRVGGMKSYIVQKDVNGKARQITIGNTTAWTLDLARKEARRLLVEMDKGVDPTEQQRKARKQAEAQAITVRKAFEAYRTTRTLKPGTAHQYELIVNRVFADWLDRPITELTKAHVLKRHDHLKRESGHAYADYAMRVLSAILADAGARHDDADGRSIIPENPVHVLRHVKAWEKPKRRESHISEDDLPTWFKTLEALRYCKEEPTAAVGCDYLELVVFTGLRRNEAATLKWEAIDFTKRTVRIGYTKNDKPLLLPLTDPLIALLERRKVAADRIGSPWVFPSPSRKNAGTHLVEPQYIVDKVTAACGVKFTIHDLRRTFSTVAAQLIGYYHLKRLLNHTMSGDVTAGYIVDNVESLREPMQKVTDRLMKLKADGQGMRISEAS